MCTPFACGYHRALEAWRHKASCCCCLLPVPDAHQDAGSQSMSSSTSPDSVFRLTGFDIVGSLSSDLPALPLRPLPPALPLLLSALPPGTAQGNTIAQKAYWSMTKTSIAAPPLLSVHMVVWAVAFHYTTLSSWRGCMRCDKATWSS